MELNDKRYTSMESKNCLALFFSVIAFVISILIVIPLLNDCGRQFDYIGAIIGILALLVTILMAWNIYTVIDIKSLKNEIEARDERLTQNLDIEINEYLIQSELTQVNIFAKNNEWIKALPLLSNIVHRMIIIYNKDKRYLIIGELPSTITQMINEISGEDINRSDLHGFMTLFKNLGEHDTRINEVFDEYEKKKSENQKPAQTMLPVQH